MMAAQLAPRGNGRGPLPLSFGQRRLWFVERLAPGRALYNEPLIVVELAGVLDRPAVQQSLDHLLQRHEVLRAVIEDEAGEPRMRVLPARPCHIDERDLRTGDREATERLVAEFLDAEALRPFDLARGPLARFALLRTDEDRHVFVAGLHHVVSDGWSVRVLLRELAATYGDIVRGRSPGTSLPVLSLQYADYAAWQRRRVAAGELAAEESYWAARLRGAPPTLPWPPDRTPASAAPLEGAHVSALLDTEALDRLRAEASAALGKDGGAVTRFMVLLAAWLVVLHRRSGALDLCVGTAVAGRVRRDLEPLIGFFVNVLVLRTDVSGNPRFLQIVDRVRATVLGALAHQELPFDCLVERLGAVERGGRQPLVNVFFAYHNFRTEEHVVEGLTLRRLRHDRGGAKFDVALLAVEDEEQERSLTLQLWYDASCFDEETMRAALREVCTLVERFTPEHLAVPLMALDGLVEPERDLEEDWA